MAKLYIKQEVAILKMKPRKETVNFLLNYSKALSIVKIGKQNIEIIAN